MLWNIGLFMHLYLPNYAKKLNKYNMSHSLHCSENIHSREIYFALYLLGQTLFDFHKKMPVL